MRGEAAGETLERVWTWRPKIFCYARIIFLLRFRAIIPRGQ